MKFHVKYIPALNRFPLTLNLFHKLDILSPVLPTIFGASLCFTRNDAKFSKVFLSNCLILFFKYCAMSIGAMFKIIKTQNQIYFLASYCHEKIKTTLWWCYLDSIKPCILGCFWYDVLIVLKIELWEFDSCLLIISSIVPAIIYQNLKFYFLLIWFLAELLKLKALCWTDYSLLVIEVHNLHEI